jgi:hypothetical protein
MALQPQQPVTVTAFGGETTILPALAEPGKIYVIFRLQLLNRGKKRLVELKEGVIPRWRGELDGGQEITIKWSDAFGWRFSNNTPLSIKIIGSTTVEVNVLSYATLRVNV